MTTIYFIRHAEPDYSEHEDEIRPLTEKGMSDRALVSAFLADKDISVIYSSPYLRAKQTIEDFAERQELGINTERELRERKVGDEWIEDFDSFARRQWEDGDFHLPEGESLNEVRKRLLSAFRCILAPNRGKSIAASGHGTALSAFISYLDPTFGYEDFTHIKMPHAAEFIFDDADNCVSLTLHDLFMGESEKRI